MNILKRGMVFITFFGCCFAIALMAAAMSTRFWLEAEAVQQRVGPDNTLEVRPNSTGHVNFGLFKGRKSLNVGFGTRLHSFDVVCADGDCMYSCADTKEHREEQLWLVKNGTVKGLTKHCPDGVNVLAHPSPRLSPLSELSFGESSHSSWSFLFPKFLDTDLMGRRWYFPLSMALKGETKVSSQVVESSRSDLSNEKMLQARVAAITNDDASVAREIFIDENTTDWNSIESTVTESTTTESTTTESTTTESTSTTPAVKVNSVFMNYGLWVGTIVCLSLGMVFAVVGALFAVINTATTPVEAITGVPGLYLWNGLAALFNLICVILWAVQYHKYLTHNVLLYDAVDGWTTENNEVFGYSYWLVVVAIFVHVVNIGIIFMGTYEPKIKEQLQAPDPKGGNIMLY
nr:uncharacterized protein LOC128692767 isoform X1 [Cherax quadricarinatus]